MLNKLNKNLYLMCAAMAMGIASSCTSDAPEIPAEELYTREWVKNFGVMDATQDWNNATRGSVQVDVKGGPKRVRVTTVIDDVTYLLADYPEVSGVQKLEFDIPRGLTDIKVMTASRAIRTQVGGSATFAEFASVAGAVTAEGAGVVPVTGDDNTVWDENGIKVTKVDYLVSDANEPLHYRDKLPEGEFNVGKVPTNFQFTSNGSFIVYPIYWNTSATNTIGIYTVDESTGEFNYYPFYTIKRGDELQYQTELTPAPKNAEFKYSDFLYGDNGKPKLPAEPSDLSDVDKKNFMDYLENYEWLAQIMGSQEWPVPPVHNIEVVSWGNDPNAEDYGTITVSGFLGGDWKTPEAWSDHKDNTASYHPDMEYNAWRSKGFKIDIEEGIKFGMYLKHSDGHLFYSQAEYNEEITKDGKTFNIPHASTYIHHCTNEAGEYKEFRVLAFEDWNENYGSEGPDLNDVVLYITSANVEEIPDVEDHDADPIKWLIAAEDLGSVDDFDFNDVVFEVEHAAGRLVATIRPLAAGGTLETYLCRDGKRVNNREWHSLFGHSHTTMVNTGRATGRASTFTIDVPADFSLTSSSAGSGSIHENYKQNMGGFSIEVVREDGRVSTIEAPGVGTAPQMILIFQKDDKKWRWPVERVNIKSAYPRFESWMNPSTGFSLDTDGDNWFDFPTSVAGSLFNR